MDLYFLRLKNHPILAGLFLLALILSHSYTHAEITIPKQSDWTDRGIVLEGGPAGSWDVRLSGMINPGAVVKKNGIFYFYYVGADGDRSTDGGPRHRALGVATSTDGINFTKYANNPILKHLPNNNEEEGIFSVAAILDANGDVVLYYGAMDAGNSTSESVDSDVRLALSSDGINFTDVGDVISHSDKSVWGKGDELFPLGAFHNQDTWFVYYTAKGSGAYWDLGLAWGPSKNNFNQFQPVLTDSSDMTDAYGGGDVVRLGPEKIALFLLLSKKNETRPTEVKTAFTNSPITLSAPVYTYSFSDTKHSSVFLDTETNTWFMYHLDSAGETIRVRTVSVAGGVDIPPMAPTALRILDP